MRYDIEIKGLEELKKSLDPKIYDKASRRTVRRMGQRFRATASKEVRKEYNIPAKEIKKRVTKGQFKSKGGEYVYSFYIQGRPINVVKFGARQLKKGGVSIKGIKRGSGRIKFRHAFLTTDKNGNPRVFERRGKKRLPIDGIFTLSVPQMFNEKVLKAASKEVMGNFEKELLHNIEF